MHLEKFLKKTVIICVGLVLVVIVGIYLQHYSTIYYKEEKRTVLAMVIVPEGVEVESLDILHRESGGDLAFDYLFVKINKADIPTILKKEEVINVIIPTKIHASFNIEESNTELLSYISSKPNVTISAVPIHGTLPVSGVFDSEDLLKILDNVSFISHLYPVSFTPDINKKIEETKKYSHKLDGALAFLYATFPPEYKVDIIVELEGIPKYEGLSYEEASKKARNSTVVKKAVSVVESLDGKVIDFWYWYESIYVEIETSKLLELAKQSFVRKMSLANIRFKANKP